MLTTSIFTFAAALSTASAAVLPRQYVDPLAPEAGDGPATGTFAITDFSVSQERYGIYTNYALSLTDTVKTGPSNITTKCHTQTNTIPAITGFANLTCDDASVKWSFTPDDKGFNLVVSHNWGIEVQHAIVTAYDNLTDTARAFFPKEDVKQNPTVDAGFDCPYLDAPSAFDLAYGQYAN